MADDDDVSNKTKSNNSRLPETFHRAQETQAEHKFPHHPAGIVSLPPGSRGPRSLYLKRQGDSFGFTLRHFIVYPPDAVTEHDGRHAAVGALSTPMDTIFVKHVKERSPAKLAGLQCGDRLVAVNRIPVTDKSYSQVVQLIQNGPDYLHLLVVPKEEDILQRFFAETAYNPATNQQTLHEYPSDRQTAKRFLTQTFNQCPGEFKVDALSWRSLQNPYMYIDRSLKSVDNLSTNQNIYTEIEPNEQLLRQKSRAQPQVPLYRKMGRRASDGCTLTADCTNLKQEFEERSVEMPALRRHPIDCRIEADRRRESTSSSLSSSSLADGNSLNSYDSTSTLTGHETDDSAIMTRYRKSFQQKEEFLRMPTANESMLIQREFYGRPKKLDKSMWPPVEGDGRAGNVKPIHQNFQRVKDDIENERDLKNQAPTKNVKTAKEKNFMSNLNKIQETGLQQSIATNDPASDSQNDDDVFDDKRSHHPKLHIVHKRTQQFESGKPLPEDDPTVSDRTSFYRSELARLSSKRVVPNVCERAQEYEIRSLERDTSGTSTNSGATSKRIQRDSHSLDSSDDSYTSNGFGGGGLGNAKFRSGNVMVSCGSKYIHCPLPKEYQNSSAETTDLQSIKVRARSNSAESWVSALSSTDKKDTTDEDGNEIKEHQKQDDEEDVRFCSPLQSPLIPESVEQIRLTPLVSITPVPTTPQTKAIRPTQLDLEGPVRPLRHLKPPSTTTPTTTNTDMLLRRPITPVIGEDNKPVVVKRRTKSTNVADDERAMRRESYLKATEGGRMHFDSDLSDGDVSPQILRSAHRRWKPPLFPGDIQQLRKLFEDAASTLGGSLSGNSSSSVSLEREKHNASPSDKHQAIIKEGPLHCKITEIDGKRSGDRSWKQIWASLKGPKLYLHKDKHHQSPIGTSDAVDHSLSSGVDMRASVVRVAEDYTKRKHVLRVSSVNPCRSEFLLQADNTEELADWVKALQEQMATTTEIEAQFDPTSGNHKQQAVPQTNPASTTIQVQGSRLSPQPKTKTAPPPPLSGAATRNRSPTGQSPVNKTRKPAQSGTTSNATGATASSGAETTSTSPKSKTWRRRVAQQFRRIHQGASSPNSPTAPEGSTFGIPLDHCLASRTNPYVPRFVEVCTDIVDARGLNTVGIYRVPGNNASITALTDEVNRNYDEVPLEDARWNDLHVVSSLLKSYFRKMPDSLITNAAYRNFIRADKLEDGEARMRELKRLVRNLAPHNYHTLKHIILHLKRVVENSEINKMDAKNLAIVFGPTIIRPEEENMENMVNNMTHQYKIVETLLTYADWFFGDDAEDDGRVPTLATNQGAGDVGEEGLEPINNQALLDNISKYEAFKDKEKNGALFSSIIWAAQRKVKRKSNKNMNLNENKEENFGGAAQNFDLKENTTTDRKNSVIPTTVRELEKTTKTEKVPWFNYSTDQEDFHRRIENFELETKAMLQMPRNLEISVSNIGSKSNLSTSSSSMDNNQSTKLNKSNDQTQQHALMKTHSASNVYNRTTNPHMDNSRNSLTSMLVPYSYKSATGGVGDATKNNYNNNFNKKQTTENNNMQNTNNKFIPSHISVYSDLNDRRNIGGRITMRRGSSVENLNTSNDTNANLKKIKYENEMADTNRSGSLDSLNKFAQVTDDETDLVTSLTKLYDKKLKEEKRVDGGSLLLLAGDGLPYVDDSPEKLSNRNSPDKQTRDESYRNPSLHKNGKIPVPIRNEDEDKDVDSTLVLNNERPMANCNRIISTTNKINNNTKLKRSESLNKPERTTVSPMKLKRSESLNKTGGDKLKRSDSLTKNEKTENNLNKRRELNNNNNNNGTQRRTKEVLKLKRKNGMPDRSIKRRHTVGGTKDPDKITWLDNRYHDAVTSKDKDTNKEKNLRTSSPDLSTMRRERLFFEINLIGPEDMVVALRQHLIGTRPQSFTETGVFKVPLESHV